MHANDQSDRLRGLDGLRALAISATVWMHLAMSGAIVTLLPLWWGRQGVCFFFALSGYLITLSLLRKGGLTGFYYRRAAKIFPSFYVYLAVVMVLWYMNVFPVAPGALWAAATYWINWYRGPVAWPLAHTWSLAVEEQFYLSWPLALTLLGRSRAVPAILLILVAWPVQRWMRLGRFGHVDAADAYFSATYDTILWGCLAALLQRSFPKAIKAGCHSALLPFLVATLVSIYLCDFWPTATIPPMRGLLFSWIILWITQNSRSLVTRILELAPIKWIGKRSYSIYLWHILFCDPRFHQKAGIAGALFAMMVTSAIGYRLLETRPGERV